MGMSDVIKKNWELKEDSSSTVLRPKQKSFMAIYRKDQKISLNHLIPKNLKDIPKLYDFVIASQAFRLRSPYQRTLNLVLLPLSKIIGVFSSTIAWAFKERKIIKEDINFCFLNKFIIFMYAAMFHLKD